MKIVFSGEAWSDYLYWQQYDKNLLKKLNRLIEDTCRSPFSGLGKPEPLRHELRGYYSRRITQEHRLVYKIENDSLVIVSVRRHY